MYLYLYFPLLLSLSPLVSVSPALHYDLYLTLKSCTMPVSGPADLNGRVAVTSPRDLEYLERVCFK